jgi:RHS repeat-associated protein
VNEQLFYPWGTLWEDTSQSEFHFAAFDWGYLTPGILPTPNRMYSYGKGRWMTPDPAGLAAGDASNPESLNRYSYVMNNPTSLIDPSGLDPVPCPPGSPPGEICIQVNGNPLPGGFDGGGIGGGAPSGPQPCSEVVVADPRTPPGGVAEVPGMGVRPRATTVLSKRFVAPFLLAGPPVLREVSEG